MPLEFASVNVGTHRSTLFTPPTRLLLSRLFEAFNNSRAVEPRPKPAHAFLSAAVWAVRREEHVHDGHTVSHGIDACLLLTMRVNGAIALPSLNRRFFPSTCQRGWTPYHLESRHSCAWRRENTTTSKNRSSCGRAAETEAVRRPTWKQSGSVNDYRKAEVKLN